MGTRWSYHNCWQPGCNLGFPPPLAKDLTRKKAILLTISLPFLMSLFSIWSQAEKARDKAYRETTLKLYILPPLQGVKIYSWGNIAHTPLLLLFLLTSLFSMSLLISVWVTKTRSGLQRFPPKTEFFSRFDRLSFDHQRLSWWVRFKGCRSMGSDPLNCQ